MTIRLAIPNKGRLFDQAIETLAAAGIRLDYSSDRKLFASGLNGRVKVLFTRAEDIPGFVAIGAAELGITGRDLVEEAAAEVEELVDLKFGKCALVVAVPQEWRGPLKNGLRVATPFPNLAARFFKERKLTVELVPVSGAAEAAPHLGVADIIVDLTSTGSTLEMNHMKPLETLLESTARLVANPKALTGPVGIEMRELAFALESVVAARGKKYLMADIPEAILPQVTKLLPGIEGPTVVPIEKPGWIAIQVVVDEKEIYDKVNALRKLGARGILVVPIERLVP